MGAAPSAPTPDLRTKKAMAIAHLSLSDLSTFYSKFQALDRLKRGQIDIADFYSSFDERRSIYGDGIFELLGIRHSGNLNFGEFVQAIVSMCLFEEEEMLKYCFYVFDKDKNGYLEGDELNTILDVFHHVSTGETLKGNQKIAKDKIKRGPDNKVEYPEMHQIAKNFPSLWYPAFRIQNNMMREYLGDKWWTKKKRFLQDLKDTKLKRKNEKDVSGDKKYEKVRQRKIRKKLGICKYYLCPWSRTMYDKIFPKRSKGKLKVMTEEELADLRKKAREEAKRLEDLLVKNPENQNWHNYQNAKHAKAALRIKNESGGNGRRGVQEEEERRRPKREKVAKETRLQKMEMRRERLES